MVRRATGSPLVDAHVRGEPGVRRFLPDDWRDAQSYRHKAERVRERFDRAALERAAEAIHAPAPAAAERLRRVVEEGGVMVTTGQQPGLFGGPLYSVYKALTALRLADALEERLGLPVLPLFWIAADDHDWEEAHDTRVVDTSNDLRRVEVARPDAVEGEPPLHRIALDADVERALAEFLGALPETDFSPRWRELLERVWVSGRTLADGFQDTLEALLGPLGLAFTRADDPALKHLSLDILRAEARNAERHERVLLERDRALEAEGHALQVSLLEGGVNLFVEGPAGRERLYRTDRGFQLRHSARDLSLDELLGLLDEEPERVSPNVLLRPVVESAVFPTVSYVAGPGEMAYFAQLPPLFEAHGLETPVVHPRFSVTAVEGKVRKVLDKFDLELDELAAPFHELAGRIARDEVPDDVQRILGELRGAVGQQTAALQRAVQDLDPTLKGPISTARSAAFDALGDLEKKIVQAVKRESEVTLQQLEKARLHLFPDGVPQERRMNPFYYVFRYGEQFLHDVAARFDAVLPSPVEHP